MYRHRRRAIPLEVEENVFGPMTYVEAIEHVKAGKSARRLGWEGGYIYLSKNGLEFHLDINGMTTKWNHDTALNAPAPRNEDWIVFSW